MSVAPFTRIVVDKKEERKFRRRALHAHPFETIEALWGKTRGDILYICAFVKMNIDKRTLRTLNYDDQELDFHEEDAAEAGLKLIGTIHSHPNADDTIFSEQDLRDSQESNELVMGICAIINPEKGKKGRRKCEIAYWPTLRPLIAIRGDAEIPKNISKTGKTAARRKR